MRRRRIVRQRVLLQSPCKHVETGHSLVNIHQRRPTRRPTPLVPVFSVCATCSRIAIPLAALSAARSAACLAAPAALAALGSSRLFQPAPPLPLLVRPSLGPSLGPGLGLGPRLRVEGKHLLHRRVAQGIEVVGLAARVDATPGDVLVGLGAKRIALAPAQVAEAQQTLQGRRGLPLLPGLRRHLRRRCCRQSGCSRRS